MEITIKATPKEIAALVLELQEQHEQNDMTFSIDKLADQLSSSISRTRFKTL